MSRLIDADELIERLKDECEDCELNEKDCAECLMLWLVNLIDDMPTISRTTMDVTQNGDNNTCINNVGTLNL